MMVAIVGSGARSLSHRRSAVLKHKHVHVKTDVRNRVVRRRCCCCCCCCPDGNAYRGHSSTPPTSPPSDRRCIVVHVPTDGHPVVCRRKPRRHALRRASPAVPVVRARAITRTTSTTAQPVERFIGG